MKIHYKLTLSALLITLLFSCRTDEFTVEKGDLAINAQVNLTGIILNEDNQAVNNAFVSLSDNMVETDENGVFSFKNVELSTDGSLIKVEKFGYFDGFFFAYGETNKQSHLAGVTYKLNPRSSFYLQPKFQSTFSINRTVLDQPTAPISHNFNLYGIQLGFRHSLDN